MPRFDRNQSTLIQQKIHDNINLPTVGVVDQVFEHSASDDDSNWEIDVLINGKTTKLTRVPVHTPGSDVITPPKKGDKILIIYTSGTSMRPIAFGTGWSNLDRPPLGKAGMYRNRFESDTSPAGDGDLHITGYTSYDKTPASNDKRDLTPEETFIQIAKHAEGENPDPSEAGDLPAKIEMYDSPKNDESRVTIKGNQIDGDDTKSLSIDVDFKTGVISITGVKDATGDEYSFELDVKNETAELVGDSEAGYKMGATFDFLGNGFKISDGRKFGIRSDGSGNFVWDHKSIDFNEVSGSTGGLSL